ncbi:Short-chain dehydrogenase/reductase SDRA [Zea mays]|uniref:Short-chain dehydrogenase/reductase SDRA n=3 Tax=Zea mays TaxID=4577 RepID=A0A1D6MBR4_MAIZE|nr:Short-chain dehydrogenase/reductase SDRA [Zea mays]
MDVKCRRLEGKVAVVTASTQGIGLAIAERLGLEGAAAVVSSRKQKNVDEAVEGLKAKGITVVGAVCHVSDAQQRKNIIETAVKVATVEGGSSLSGLVLLSSNQLIIWLQNFGHIDILVSNAAANPTVNVILEMKEVVLDKLWDINVKASILLIQDAAPHLRAGSSVILISSIAGYNPEQGLTMYGVTKTALFGLTKALAGEMGPDIRVNCIAPGFVPTRFASFFIDNETIRKKLNERTMLKRLGSVEDMAAAAAFLASDDASFITAETIVVAGGVPSRL